MSEPAAPTPTPEVSPMQRALAALDAIEHTLRKDYAIHHCTLQVEQGTIHHHCTLQGHAH